MFTYQCVIEHLNILIAKNYNAYLFREESFVFKGILITIVLMPVIAQRVLVNAESIPPDTFLLLGC